MWRDRAQIALMDKRDVQKREIPHLCRFFQKYLRRTSMENRQANTFDLPLISLGSPITADGTERGSLSSFEKPVRRNSV